MSEPSGQKTTRAEVIELSDSSETSPTAGGGGNNREEEEDRTPDGLLAGMEAEEERQENEVEEYLNWATGAKVGSSFTKTVRAPTEEKIKENKETKVEEEEASGPDPTQGKSKRKRDANKSGSPNQPAKRIITPKGESLQAKLLGEVNRLRELADRRKKENSRITHEEVLQTCDIMEEYIRKVGEAERDEVTEGKTTTEASTQTTAAPSRKREEAKIFPNMMWAELKEELGKRWEGHTFVCTRTERGSPFTQPGSDTVLLVGKGEDSERGLVGALKRRKPDVAELLSKQGTGKVAYLTETTAWGTGEEEEEDSTTVENKFTYAVMVDDSRGTELETENMFKALHKIKRLAERWGRTKLAVAARPGIKTLLLRCLVEAVFKGTNMEVIICNEEKKQTHAGAVSRKEDAEAGWTLVRGKRRLEEEKQETPLKPKGWKRRNEAVIVEATKEKPYEELLREAKTAIKEDGQTLEAVKGVRKTREGNLLIEIEKKNDSAAKVIRTLLIEKMEGAKIRGGHGDEKVVKIVGVDEVTTAEEVREALREVLNKTEEPNTTGTEEVLSVRREGGIRMAIVRMKKEEADKILEAGRIRVGITPCRVQEGAMTRDDIKCYKCWEMGHMSRECKGPDRTDMCLRCGEAGHQARTCRKTPFCPICAEEGHRADTRGCKRAGRKQQA